MSGYVSAVGTENMDSTCICVENKYKLNVRKVEYNISVTDTPHRSSACDFS